MGMFGKNEIRKALDNFEKAISTKPFDMNAENLARANADQFKNQGDIALAKIKQAIVEFNEDLETNKKVMDSAPALARTGVTETYVKRKYEQSLNKFFTELKKIKKHFL